MCLVYKWCWITSSAFYRQSVFGERALLPAIHLWHLSFIFIVFTIPHYKQDEQSFFYSFCVLSLRQTKNKIEYLVLKSMHTLRIVIKSNGTSFKQSSICRPKDCTLTHGHDHILICKTGKPVLYIILKGFRIVAKTCHAFLFSAFTLICKSQHCCDFLQDLQTVWTNVVLLLLKTWF